MRILRTRLLRTCCGAAGPGFLMLTWELESERQLHLLLSCAAENCIPHQSMAWLMSHGSPAGCGAGRAARTLALHKNTHHNPELWPQENKTLNSTF